MGTGFRGTFVISWSQTELDGLDAPPPGALRIGAAWAWHGDAVQVDGPNDILRLDGANGEAELRASAARKVRRLIGTALGQGPGTAPSAPGDPLLEDSFVVTNGAQSFTVTQIAVGRGQPPLLMFVNELPPRDTELWIVHRAGGRRDAAPGEGGVVCVTPGTRIATPHGALPVETLREGGCVLTRDSGPQEIRWIGRRRISGARLRVMPHLRPVRFRAGALGIDRPDRELLVSPDHRMLVRGPAAQALFNTPEVLVTAADLVNGSSIATEPPLQDVLYIHLMLPSHQVIWANGVETESFHPAGADPETLGLADRIRLRARFPETEGDPYRYGEFARRCLNRSEAAILRYDAA